MSQEARSRSGAPAVVGVRELREDTSAVVAAVETGDWFLVSKRGRPVGVLLPSAMAEDLLLEHAAEIVALQLRAGRTGGRSSRRRSAPTSSARGSMTSPSIGSGNGG